MLTGIGLDIIEIRRLKAAIRKKGFLKRIYRPAEITACLRAVTHRQACRQKSVPTVMPEAHPPVGWTDPPECGGINYVQSLAARFAAKEAFLKAIGTGWGTKQSPHWKEIEILNDKSGRPFVKLSGKARQIARRQGIKHIHLSLTHTTTYALAFVICER